MYAFSFKSLSLAKNAYHPSSFPSPCGFETWTYPWNPCFSDINYVTPGKKEPHSRRGDSIENLPWPPSPSKERHATLPTDRQIGRHQKLPLFSHEIAESSIRRTSTQASGDVRALAWRSLLCVITGNWLRSRSKHSLGNALSEPSAYPPSTMP